MKRILIITHDSGRTGAPIGLLAFARWLRQEQNCVLGIIIGNSGALEGEFRELGLSFFLSPRGFWAGRLGRRLRRFVPCAFWDPKTRLRSFVQTGNYDLIYSNTIMNGETLEALREEKLPVVTHVHELAYWIWRGGKNNFDLVKKNTDQFIAVSKAVRDNLVRNHAIPEDRITVVYEHIRELPTVPTDADRQAARAQLGIPKGALVVGGCGAEHWRKGRDLIPLLLLELRKAAPEQEWHFVWVGRPGTEEEEYQLHYDLESAGLAGSFHASGEVTDPFKLFPAFDVFALLSRDDPYPLACLEVAATEVPVVCFEGGGGIPEFSSAGCGRVAPYLNLESMARAIAEFGSDSRLRCETAARARCKVKNENLLEATAPQLLAVIELAIASRD